MSTTASDLGSTEYGSEPTGWIGWIWFAGVMMMISGGLQFFYGLVAAVNDEWVVWTNSGDLYLDLTAWGWVHMIIGVIVVLSGVGVMTGNMAARAVGVVLASLSLVANFLSLPAYPIWSIVVIVLDMLVIYALVVHGDEARTA